MGKGGTMATTRKATKKNTNLYDVLISGAGIPGLTLGLLLARAGIEAAIIDPAPAAVLLNASPDTRTVALMQGSIGILRNTDVWDDCVAQDGIMATLKIVDDSGLTKQPATVTFHASDIGQDIFGVNMPNNILRAALAARAMKQPRLKILPGVKLESWAADNFGVTASTNTGDLRAKLIVGADGRNSAVRTGADIEMWERDYGQSAITCIINHTKPHDDTSTEFHRPTGPFALVPLPGNVSSVVWVDKTEAADSFMKMGRDSFTRALQDRSRDMLGTVTLAKEPQSFPLKAMKANTLTARRMALIAEAAHVLHPLTAQGLNLSLRDAAVLAEIVIEYVRAGIDPGSIAVTSAYESRRRLDVSTRLRGTDSLNRMISNDRKGIHALRRAGLKTIENFPFLREFVMQQAMAPSFSLRHPAAERG
jgi:2-octaprenyl-6-methoxyphenol hydroxylase